MKNNNIIHPSYGVSVSYRDWIQKIPGILNTWSIFFARRILAKEFLGLKEGGEAQPR